MSTPREAQAPATAEDLGRLLVVFRPAKRYALLAGWLLLGLFPFAFLGGTTPLGTPVVGVVLWPWMVHGLMNSPVLVKSVAARRIHLHEMGFVYADAADERELFRWDQITTVFQHSQTRRIGRLTNRRYRYVVTRADGHTIKLTHAWDGMERLAREIRVRVTRAQLPVARAELDQGRSVRFGKLVVDASGVTGPRGAAPWREIDIVTSRRGRFALLAADRFLPLFSSRVWRIPNIQLFLAIYRLRREDGA
jgi:hypothetical protein